MWYDVNMKRHPNTSCKTCKTPVYRRPSDFTKTHFSYCSQTCKVKDGANFRGSDVKYQNYIKKWKAGETGGMKGQTGISNHVRRYLFEKYDKKCCKCGWNETNTFTGKIPLEVEHKDGNHRNNNENNLELICPNCHSLTSTYRALNWGKGRPRK